MICSPASPARCSTCDCSSSHSSTSGSGKCTANCLAPTTSNFRLDFFALLWYLMAIAALLFQRKVLIPDSIRVRAESRYFLFQVSTKGGTTSGITPQLLPLWIFPGVWQRWGRRWQQPAPSPEPQEPALRSCCSHGIEPSLL